MWRFRPFVPLSFSFIFFFCFALLSAPAQAETSVNIPVGSRVYRDLERLEVKGLIDSSMLATKPFDRAEGARLAVEAGKNAARNGEKDVSRARPIINRLEREFRREISSPGDDYARFKPLESIYFKTLLADKAPSFAEVNNNGDEFSDGLNQRLGLVLTGSFFDVASFYANPEFRADEDNARASLVTGYVKFDFFGMSLLAGRDPMWWGSASNGNLIITNNARPFDMVSLTSHRPFLLPWVFRHIGLIKPTVFLARLEQEREYPRANLLGMRLDFKPAPFFQFGFSRVIMFGGEGRRSLSISDWANVFIASDSAEHTSSPIDGNQIVSVDGSYVYVNDREFIPFSGVKLYFEIGAEDSSGKTRTPTTRAYLAGLLVDEPLWLKDFDFRAEYTTTARSDRHASFQWYRHHVYTDGYTYHGRIIGHQTGSDAKDLFLRARYHTPSGGVVGAEFDHARSDVHAKETARKWYGADVDLPVTDAFSVSGGTGYEEIRAPGSPETLNWVAWAGFDYRF